MRIAQSNYEIATLEVDRARAGHLPDGRPRRQLHGAGRERGGSSSDFGGNSRTALFGVALNVPIYQGGFVELARARGDRAAGRGRAQTSRSRGALALFNAQDGFSGVNSAAASVKAFEQAVASAEVALQSNILGQEVGVRTNLDVLNVQQNVFSTRRDLANAYFQYLIAVLRLKSAVGDARPSRTSKSSIAGWHVLSVRAARELRREPRPQAVGGAAMRGVEGERARRASLARRGGSSQQRARRPRAARRHRRRAPRRRAATACSAASAKLNVCGPTSVGVPAAIASIRFWPPSGSRLPPTNATSAAA